MSVKGKKVLHIDRNDHYGGSANYDAFDPRWEAKSVAASLPR